MIDPGQTTLSGRPAEDGDTAEDTVQPDGREPRILYLSASSGMAEDREWIFALQERFDALHWHGGFDGLTPDCARQVIEALARAGKPLVVTLEAPEVDQPPAEAFVRAAAAVVVRDEPTRTRVGTTFGVAATVVPDPDSEDDAFAVIHRAVVRRAVVDRTVIDRAVVRGT